MSATITEKILSRAAGQEQVSPGDNIWVNADILLTHDVCGPGTIGVFQREFGRDAKVFDKEKVVLIPDHYIFTADEKAHRNVDALRDFVKEQGLPYFYDPGTPIKASAMQPWPRKATSDRARSFSEPIRTHAPPALSGPSRRASAIRTQGL